MKVKELISDLSAMDQEAEITVQTYAGCHGLDNSFEISGTDFWDASEKHKTPATAFIEVGVGCFCDGNRGSKIKKLNLTPQNLDQKTIGLDEARDVVAKQLDWYKKELQRLGNGKDYKEHMDVERFSQAKRALETVLRDIGKKLR